MDNSSIANRIVKVRNLLNLNQKELAEKIGYKGAAAISKLEKSQRELKIKTIDKISNALNVHTNWLSHGEINKNFYQYLRDTESGRRMGDDPFPIDRLAAAEKLKMPLKFIDAIFSGDISPSNEFYIALCQELEIPPILNYADHRDSKVQMIEMEREKIVPS